VRDQRLSCCDMTTTRSDIACSKSALTARLKTQNTPLSERELTSASQRLEPGGRLDAALKTESRGIFGYFLSTAQDSLASLAAIFWKFVALPQQFHP
jgi:hypothetical protein